MTMAETSQPKAATASAYAPGAEPGFSWRKPAWAWAPLAFVASPFIGALAPAFLFFAAELPQRVARANAAGLGSPEAFGDVVTAIRVFAFLGLAASVLVGGLWFGLTRAAPRRARWGIALECAGVGAAFAVLLGLGLAGAAFFNPDAGVSLASAGAVALTVGVFGAILGAPAGLLAGLVFAPLAFKRDG